MNPKNSIPSAFGASDTCNIYKEHRRVLYANLLTTGKLNSYLADIDQQADEMFDRLTKQMAAAEGITERLKTTDQMEWVMRMNSIRNRAMEIVKSEIIYA